MDIDDGIKATNSVGGTTLVETRFSQSNTANLLDDMNQSVISHNNHEAVMPIVNEAVCKIKSQQQLEHFISKMREIQHELDGMSNSKKS